MLFCWILVYPEIHTLGCQLESDGGRVGGSHAEQLRNDTVVL